MCGSVEADFTQFYNADLRDLFDPENRKVTLRWVISHLLLLPDEARTPKKIRNDLFDRKEHLLTDIFEVMRSSAFYSSVSASVDAGKQARKVFKEAPDPVVRPRFKDPEKEKPRFLSGRELKAMMHG